MLYLSEVLLEVVSVIISVAFFWAAATFASPLTPKMFGLLVFIDVTDDLESLTKWLISNDLKQKIISLFVWSVG